MNQHAIFTALLRFALFGGEKPSLEGADYNYIYIISQRNGVCGLIYHAICTTGAVIPAETEGKMRASRDKAVLLHLRRFSGAEHITALFETAEIPCVLLKGQTISDLYPSPEYRESCDTDILVPKGFAEIAGKVLLSDGYTEFEHGETVISYKKSPGDVIELHIRLDEGALPPCLEKSAEEYERVGEGRFAHSLTPSENYIYLICHTAKHLRGAGCGIRFVCDAALMLEKCEIDAGFVKSELERVGLDRFENSVRQLVAYWFHKGDANDEIKVFDDFLIASSLYGSHAVSAAIKQKASPVCKTGYALKRLFPPYAEMKKSRPRLARHPCLLPFFWCGRLCLSVFRIGGKAKAELSAYDFAKGGGSDALAELYKGIGLDI